MLVLVLVFRSSPFLLRQEASAERTAAVKGARGDMARRSEPLRARSVLRNWRKKEKGKSGNLGLPTSDSDRPIRREGVADRGASATVDHSDIRGSKPHNRDSSGAASD